MLLNTWLSAARRHFTQRSTTRRVVRSSSPQSAGIESLEARSLLTALVINPDNKLAYTNATGGIEVTNANLGGNDSLVIEGISVSATSGNGISINLSGVQLKSLAIETINISQYGSANNGVFVNLTNVTGLHTIAFENNIITGTGRGLDLRLTNTDTDALTIDDSTIPGLQVMAGTGSDIGNGLITKSTIVAGIGFEGIKLDVNQGTADNFHIENNVAVSSPNRDFIRVNSTNAPIDGLSIVNNNVGTQSQGAGILFRADGDTFIQPMTLTNSSLGSARLQTFVLDLTPLGLGFDEDVTTGKAFTASAASRAATGLVSSVVSVDKKSLTLTFNNFDPGESIDFVIDIDIAGGVPASIFGNDLIGARVQTVLSSSVQPLTGLMVGDPLKTTASEFATGPRSTGSTDGIVLGLTNSPATNINISNNVVAGSPRNALLIDAKANSDVTGMIRGNELISSGKDGLRLQMTDSNFAGAVLGNTIANNFEGGISILPSVSISGQVEAILPNSPARVTSKNHGLVTGEQIIIQGVVDQQTGLNNPVNGLRTVTVIDADHFTLNLVNLLGTAFSQVPQSGQWYKPQFLSDGTIRGLVTVDMQASAPKGTIRTATNAGPIVISSPNHGLATGQRIRVSNVNGNTAANGVQKVTVIDANTFSLDGTTGNGIYDTSTGFGTWTGNVVTSTTNSANTQITSPGHGLTTGEEIRITGVIGNTAVNGTFKVAVIDPNTFRLVGANGAGVTGNGVYGGGGNWVRLTDGIQAAFPNKTATGLKSIDKSIRVPQRISGNSITGNGAAGIHVDLNVGTVFNGDIVSNTISQNKQKGIYIESHSFGLGTDLPLDANDPLALPGLQDISFNVNIGTSATGDGNILNGNTEAGIAIEALDNGTGSFQIRNNRITSTKDASTANGVYNGDGISVRLAEDLAPQDAYSLLAESIIDGNIIGVDNQGNEGNGLNFNMKGRTRIQDLQLTNNTFLNNGLDGFHFERSEDADLNSVIAEKNRATNNKGDGFSFFASNTAKDRLDFRVNENTVSNNDQYGMRLEIVVDARVDVQFNRNEVTGNGGNSAQQGFHPNDGVVGSTKAAGGVGIFGDEQSNIQFISVETKIDDNRGDGFSFDATNASKDSVVLNVSFTNSTLSGNDLTGFRAHGNGFGTITFAGSQLNGNGEDGFRNVSIDDKNDVNQNRVGGNIIFVQSMNSQFNENGKNGMKLGQGVSAVLGDGTIANANYFDLNGGAGLKVTQSAGAYLLGQNAWDRFQGPLTSVDFQYVNRRLIQANTNFFRTNTGAGIDIGHFAATEGGNVEQGDEVITDTYVTVRDAQITGNGGDGIEYLADSVLRITPVVGAGQDVEYPHKSGLAVSNSRITNNAQRGIDILNRVGEDSTISIINTQILSNGYEGVYVLNTASHFQLQGSSADPLLAMLEPRPGAANDFTNWFSVNELIRQLQDGFEISPNIELRAQDNLIQSNGSRTVNSVVPYNVSNTANDNTGVVNTDWTHNFRTIAGTLGGFVVRVGSVDSVGRVFASNAARELGLSGIDAEIVNNRFDGNVGADVYFDSYTSQIAPQTTGNFSLGETPPATWETGYRDPLSRFDLVFRGNSGNSLDVINGFAYVNNLENYYKSRAVTTSTAPNHVHSPLNPSGWFSDGNGFSRFRNQTRTMGFFDPVGTATTSDIGQVVPWGYDGTGTPTWRVESDFDSNRFTTTDPSLGFSDFFDATQLGISLGEEQYQWDTGRNVAGFTGATPYSLSRGDIFNVRAGEAPIKPDSLEENDNFIGATPLGTVSGTGYSVNALAASGLLTIDKKGDRDYYAFTAGGSGALNINLGATDALGDDLYVMLYEVQPGEKIQYVPVFASNTSPTFVQVAPGAAGTLSTTVVAGQRYVIEILSDEAANVGRATKSFVYGTARSYQLTMDAPVAVAPGPSPGGGGNGSGGNSGSGNGTGGGGGANGGGGPLGGNLPGSPPLAAWTAVSPSPRATSAGTVTLTFTEDVTGVDVTDIKLTRNAQTVALTASMFSQVDPFTYTLNLGNITAESGAYLLKLTAAGSNIRDTDSSLLTVDATATWIVNNSVTTTLDSIDNIVGDGLALDVNGRTSLRAAVMESNATPDADTITLGTGTYLLTLAGRFETEALRGDLDIRGNVTIRGVSAKETIINAADLDRVFHVYAGATLTLENLTITGGEAFDGGGVLNEGRLNLKNVNITGNEAYSQGGGIYNTAAVIRPAVGTTPAVVVTPAGVIKSEGSSISQNVAGSRGGGIDNLGVATFVGTTISANTAVSRAGGLYNDLAATASLINVTITENAAASRGGGLFNDTPRNVTLGNSLIERNTTQARAPLTAGGTASTGKDLFGGVLSLGNNLIQTLDQRLSTAASAGLLTSDRFGRDASPLASASNALQTATGNGVATNPLKSAGIAIDAGSNTLFPNVPLLSQTDAVGNPRLIEGNGDGVVTIDVGAVEFLVNTPVAIFVANPNPAGLNEEVTFNGTGSTHPNPATGSIVKWEWDFDWNPAGTAPTVPLTDPTYNPTENFTVDATGATAKHTYTNSARTTYKVRLIVTDNLGNKGFLDKTVTVGVPTKPVVQRPFAVTTDQTPLFKWDASPAKYRLQVYSVSAANLRLSGTPVIDLSNLTSTSYTPSSKMAVGKYEVVVTSTNSVGSVLSSSYYFTISSLSLSTPTGSTFDITPKFTWAAIPGTSRYDIQVNRTAIGTQPAFVNEIIRNEFVSGNTFEATTSLGVGTFSWWVRAYDADGTVGEWSNRGTFSINRVAITTPGAATLDTTPTISWTNMNAPRYELWVDQIGGQKKIIYQPAVSTNSFTPTTPLPNGTYRVWVRPLAADGEAGFWSLAYDFRMDYRVGPTQISPIGLQSNGTFRNTTDTTPTFTWQAIDGTVNYDLQVDNLTTGRSSVIRVLVPHTANAVNINYTPTTPLTAGNYRWWVRSIGAGSVSTAWSPAKDFTVPVPAIITPSGAIQTNLPLFTWTGVTEYVKYDLWVDNLTTGKSQVLRVTNIPKSTSTTSTTQSYQTLLPFENGTLRAWVRGVDAAGNFSQWSAPSDFVISTGVGVAPRGLSPSRSSNSLPTFTWQGGTNAITFELLVKNMDAALQPIVLNVKRINGFSYTSTSTLAPGNYRWWVRGLDVNGNGLPWSQPLDFVVTSVEENGLKLETDLFDLNAVIPVVLTVQVDEWNDDGIQSFTAHPASTVVQIDPEFIEESLEPETPVVIPEQISGIDSVMEDWAAIALFAEQESSVVSSVVPVAVSVAKDQSQSSDDDDYEALNLVMSSLVIGAVALSRKPSDENERAR